MKSMFCDSRYSVNEKKLQCNNLDFEFSKLVDFAAGLVMNPQVDKID
jgi:hypothetical protein